MAKTYATRLVEIEKAIEAVETRGQSYTIAGRELTRADLPALYREERRLRIMTDREARGGGITVRRGIPS